MKEILKRISSPVIIIQLVVTVAGAIILLVPSIADVVKIIAGTIVAIVNIVSGFNNPTDKINW